MIFCPSPFRSHNSKKRGAPSPGRPDGSRSRMAEIAWTPVGGCTPLPGVLGQRGQSAVADQGSAAGGADGRGGRGQQPVGGGPVAGGLAVKREHHQVERAAAERELIPSTTPVMRIVGQDVGQVEVVVGEVGRRQPQPPHRLEPAPDPRAQQGRLGLPRRASVHTSSQSSNSTFAMYPVKSRSASVIPALACRSTSARTSSSSGPSSAVSRRPGSRFWTVRCHSSPHRPCQMIVGPGSRALRGAAAGPRSRRSLVRAPRPRRAFTTSGPVRSPSAAQVVREAQPGVMGAPPVTRLAPAPGPAARLPHPSPQPPVTALAPA